MNSKNTCGCNALHCLCSNQHYFHFSFDRQGDLEVIRFLIDSGVKVDAQTKKGETGAHASCFYVDGREGITY